MASSIVFTFLYVVYDIFKAPSIERARRDSSASQDERDAITNDQADLPALPSFQEYLQNLKWYTLYGLDEQTTQDKTFQDFELNDANPNVIKFLWAFADERENDEISSNINQENGVSFLHIEFQNKTSFGSNICILPKDRKACQTGNAKYLTFELRIPNTHHSNQPNNNQNIALNFRIVDGQLQHWCYQGQIPNVFGANYTLLTEKYQSILSDQHWVKFGLSLQDKDIWQLFEVDGNYLYGDKNHNFTILAAVIFEFGIGGRHGSGSGAIDIRKIALRTSLPKDTSIIQ
jgi:hypothetical protein